MSMSVKECEKYIRDSIREYGLVFKAHPSIRSLYVVTDRKTKEVIINNTSLGSTLCNLKSGYLSCYDKDTQNFDKSKLRNLDLIDSDYLYIHFKNSVWRG